MSNLTLIPILPGINDLPEVLEDGPNGALVTEKVNQLLSIAAKPTEVWDETIQVNFYLDTVGGIDTNDGLTQLTAFKTWEKVKAVLGAKFINNQQNTRIYVKGTLQAPLSFKGLYGLSADPRRLAYLKIYAWEDGNGNFAPYTLQGVTSELPDKRAFVDFDSTLKVKISNVTIDVPDRLVFTGCDVYFQDIIWQLHDTTAPYLLGENNDAVIFTHGKYETQSEQSFIGYRYAQMLFGDGSVNKINGQWTFDSDSNNYTAFKFVGDSVTQFTPINSSAPDVIRSLRQDKPAKVYAITNDPQWYYSGDEIPMNAIEYLPDSKPVTTLADTDLIHVSQQAESGTNISLSNFKALLSGNEDTVSTLANSDKFQVIVSGVKSLLSLASLQTLLGGNGSPPPSSSSVSKGMFSERLPSGVEYPVVLFKQRVSSDIKITAITITFMPTVNDITRVGFNGKSAFFNFFTAPRHTITITPEMMFDRDEYDNDPAPFSTVFNISADPTIYSNPEYQVPGIELGIGSLNNTDYEAYISMSYEFV